MEVHRITVVFLAVVVLTACGESTGRDDGAAEPGPGSPVTEPVSPSTTGSEPPMVSADVPGGEPQPTVGDGWRLLADELRGEPHTAQVAVNAAEYETLWSSLAMDGQAPAVDFDFEIVVQFGAVYSSSCPGIRLDDVTIEPDRASVSAEIVLLGDQDDCTADANPRSYVVAVDRSRLPAVPFRVSLRPGCTTCVSVHVHDLTGDRSPNVAMSEYDRLTIFGAAAANRVGAGNSFGGQDVFDTIDVVEVVGLADQDGFVRFDTDGVLTGVERNEISTALAPRTVRFVPATVFEGIEPHDGYAVLSIAEPARIDGELTITTGLWCGELCAIGGAHALERNDDGTWTFTPVGPQWIS